MGVQPKYTVGAYGDPPKLFRLNDGSLNIMKAGEGDDFPYPVLMVPRFCHVKQKDRWSAPDPDQEAFAQRVCDLLNAADA